MRCCSAVGAWLLSFQSTRHRHRLPQSEYLVDCSRYSTCDQGIMPHLTPWQGYSAQQYSETVNRTSVRIKDGGTA